jgi:hypothetical protein
VWNEQVQYGNKVTSGLLSLPFLYYNDKQPDACGSAQNVLLACAIKTLLVTGLQSDLEHLICNAPFTKSITAKGL